MWKWVIVTVIFMTRRNYISQSANANETDIKFSKGLNTNSASTVENTKSDNLIHDDGYEIQHSNNFTKNNFSNTVTDSNILGEIRNVSVEAIYHSDRNKVLLHISWNSSLAKDHLETFSAYVFKVTPNSTFPECDDITHETIKKNATITSIYIPIPQHSYEVKPNCNYKINLIADFLHDGNISKEISYIVPECVGKKCSCRNRKPVVTKFSAKETKPGELKISWNIQVQDHDKVNQIISPIVEYRPIVSEHHHNNPFRRISTKTEFNNNTHYIIIANTQSVFQPEQQYQLRVLFNNSYNCKTYEYTNITVNASPMPSSTVPHLREHTREAESKSNYLLQIILSVILALFITLTLAYIIRRNRLIIKEIILNPFSCSFSRRNRHPDVGSLYYVIPSGNKKQQEVNLLYIDKEILEGCVDNYELPRSRITLIREIGGGAFGQVFLGKALGIEKQLGYTYVAVKTLREGASPEEMDNFLSEIEILKKVGEHPNIVRLFGCCILREPYLMVMEFVPCGDLRHYLLNLREKWLKRSTKSETTIYNSGSYIMPNGSRSRTLSDAETEYTTLESDGYPTPTEAFNNKVESTLDHTELQSFALQIARGMEHLERIPIAHRDLAARNILINEYKTLKISDFGLSRVGPYINSKTRKLPLRWVAIEAIEDQFYDSKSDVWSFAIVLWEIGTLGAFPYENVLDALLPHYLASGKRLSRPEICSDDLYALMLRCWSHNPQERPSFKELVELLDTKKRRIYVDFNQLNPLYIFPPSSFQEGVNKVTAYEKLK